MCPVTKERAPATPVARAVARRPNVLGEILIIIALVKIYDYVRAQQAVRSGPALHNAQGVISIERWLHIDIERIANSWITHYDRLADAATWWYQLTHIPVTMAVLVWCYIAAANSYRMVRTALVATNVIALTVFSVLPVMPPRLLPNTTFVDTVADAGWGATHGGPVPADQYAAMPSLHLAWAMWAAIVAMHLLRGYRWRRLCLVYPLITGIVVVVTANHYVLDVVAGVTVTLLALFLARRLTQRRREVRAERVAELELVGQQSADDEGSEERAA